MAPIRMPDNLMATFTSSLREGRRQTRFTMNAMAYAPRRACRISRRSSGCEGGHLTLVGDPEKRFQEDACVFCGHFALLLYWLFPGTGDRALLPIACKTLIEGVSWNGFLRAEKLLCGKNAVCLARLSDILESSFRNFGPCGVLSAYSHHCHDL